MNKKDILTSCLALIIILILYLILCALSLPYKETLECEGEKCSVEKLYIICSRNSVYYFNKIDYLDIYTLYRRRASSIHIINHSDSDIYVIDNSFITRARAQKIIDYIKSNDYIRIKKYWFGDKIEKN